MTTQKKIVEILKKRVQNLIASDLISPFFWEDFAVEIESWHNEAVQFEAACHPDLMEAQTNYKMYQEQIADLESKIKEQDQIIEILKGHVDDRQEQIKKLAELIDAYEKLVYWCGTYGEYVPYVIELRQKISQLKSELNN